MSDDEILREFVLETHENLGLLDSDLVTLEKNPLNASTLAQVFRTLHSIKGTAGFMGLAKLQSVAHSAENLLSRLRAGEMQFSPPIATALLGVVDAVREMLSNIEAKGEEGSGDYSALIAEVDRLREMGDGDNATLLPVAQTIDLQNVGQTIASPHVGQTIGLPPVGQTIELPPVALPKELDFEWPLDESAPATTAVSIAEETVTDAEPDSSEQAQIATDAAATAEPHNSRGSSLSDASIRVDVSLLDKLMTLVGELVLARNQILQYNDTFEDGKYLGVVQRLNLLTTELQAGVMKTRMQPIGNVLNKFPRVVRDLALACGKSVRFEMDGQETELDKTLIEAIRDPLTHIVRNAVDHGIESPQVRLARGKPPEGRLRIVAFHEGGKVIIEITDDGGGIDAARLREKAFNAKLVSSETLARMSRNDLLRLVFLPGFSTAEKVTQFSGRGVGMDVVRTNIEKIGGTVDIESTEGMGTTIRTKIPLTLAIIPALIIVSSGDRYAIPQVSLLELVRLDSEQVVKGLESMHGAPVYRLRGSLLPLVFLDETLGQRSLRTPSDELNIVVVQADEKPFGLVVDDVRDTEEIVVKPLQKQLKGTKVFAGAAIMGDGQVALVLDVLGLAQRAHVISGVKGRGLSEEERPKPTSAEQTEQILLFAPRDGGQMAISLSMVARLEEFPRSKIENIGPNQVVQYRGEILPLIDLSEVLNQTFSRNSSSVFAMDRSSVDTEIDETVPVIVYAEAEQPVGLVVGQILDIVKESIASRSPSSRPGVLFNAIVQGKVTEFIDVKTLVCTATNKLLQSNS